MLLEDISISLPQLYIVLRPGYSIALDSSAALGKLAKAKAPAELPFLLRRVVPLGLAFLYWPVAY